MLLVNLTVIGRVLSRFDTLLDMVMISYGNCRRLQCNVCERLLWSEAAFRGAIKA
jgi:hypothetical protein